MGDLLKSFIGSLVEKQLGGGQSRSTESDPLMDMIGGILGGGSAPAPAAPASGGMDIGDIIGSLIGGGSAQKGNNAADMIGAIMGGGQKTNPIAGILAEKLGISPMIANMIVTYFTAKLLSGNANDATDQFTPGRSKSSGLDLDDLLDRVDDDQALQKQLDRSGMSDDLQKVGLDPEIARSGLKEFLKAIAGQRETPQPVQAQADGLKHLLDSWHIDG